MNKNTLNPKIKPLKITKSNSEEILKKGNILLVEYNNLKAIFPSFITRIIFNNFEGYVFIRRKFSYEYVLRDLEEEFSYQSEY